MGSFGLFIPSIPRVLGRFGEPESFPCVTGVKIITGPVPSDFSD